MSSNNELQNCTEKVKAVTGVDCFNACVVVVLYRKYNDAIGMHSDTSHKETLIATLVLQQDSSCERPVVFESKTKPKVRVELFLSAGDLYIMDDHVQRTFKHGVPTIAYHGKTISEEPTYGRRIVIVFRKGIERYFYKDSGTSVDNLNKENVVFKFGHPLNLNIGDLRTRVELYENGHHGQLQKGIDGNKSTGVKSIVLSRKSINNSLENSSVLRYQGRTGVGAKAMMKSIESPHIKKKGIRVFIKDDQIKSKSTLYEYHGLFRIIKASQVSLHSKLYNYILHRIEKRRHFTKEEQEQFVWRLRSEFGGNITLAAQHMKLNRQNLSYLNNKY